MVCFDRVGDEQVPFCSGPGVTGLDYCANRPQNWLIYLGRDVGANQTLGLCEGDCDNDAQCEGNLICTETVGGVNQPVPGCDGDYRQGAGYGRLLDASLPSASPSMSNVPTLTNTPTSKPTPSPTKSPVIPANVSTSCLVLRLLPSLSIEHFSHIYLAFHFI